MHEHPAPADVVVQLAESGQCASGHRQREPGHDRHLQQRRVVAVPAVDLGRAQFDGAFLGGHQRRRRRRSDGLHAASAHQSQPGALGLGEQGVLGVGKCRPEHHRRCGARSDAGGDEVAGDPPGEHGVCQACLGGKDAGIEPFEELPTAVCIERIRLRKVHMGVDESGQQERSTMVDDGARGGRVLSGTTVGDHPGVVDDQRPVGERRQGLACAGDVGRAGDVDDVAEICDDHRSTKTQTGPARPSSGPHLSVGYSLERTTPCRLGM